MGERSGKIANADSCDRTVDAAGIGDLPELFFTGGIVAKGVHQGCVFVEREAGGGRERKDDEEVAGTGAKRAGDDPAFISNDMEGADLERAE